MYKAGKNTIDSTRYGLETMTIGQTTGYRLGGALVVINFPLPTTSFFNRLLGTSVTKETFYII